MGRAASHCTVVAGNSWEKSTLSNCKCGSTLQTYNPNSAYRKETEEKCGAACEAYNGCRSFALWTSNDRGKCMLFDNSCGGSCPEDMATSVSTGYTNDVFNMFANGPVNFTVTPAFDISWPSALTNCSATMCIN